MKKNCTHYLDKYVIFLFNNALIKKNAYLKMNNYSIYDK